MKKRLYMVMAVVALAVLLPLASAYSASTFLLETETRLYKPEKSYNGYFLTTPMGVGGTIYLMDLWGNVYHKWDKVMGNTPQLMEDGTLWSQGYIQDWDGNVIWSFVPQTDSPSRYAKRGAYSMHHDVKRIFNKKLNQWTQLIVCNETLTQADAVAAGADPSVTYGNRLQQHDFIIEVNMNKQIVWEWDFIDHCVQSKNPAWPNYVSDVKNAPGRFDINWLTDNQRPNGQAGFVRDWAHVNSVDYDEDTDMVVINPKHFSQFVVVDHDKTFVSTTDFAKNIAAAAGPDGDVIYRWGNPAMYNAGTAPGWMTEGDQQGYGFHNIQYIRPYHWDKPHLSTDKWPDPSTYTKSGIALPGAGNFLVFDNGCYNPTGTRSRILEINGRIGPSGSEEVAKGKYIWPDVAGYKTSGSNLKYRPSRQLAWSYQASSQHSFYSHFISGCQRLPNGNTSITTGSQGQLFEVTPSGEVVWEYIWPGVAGENCKFVTSDGNNAWQNDDNRYRGGERLFRHYRYGDEYPAFANRTLTSKGTLTGRLPRLVGTSDTFPPAIVYTGFGFGTTGVVDGGGGLGTGTGGGTGGY